jgi:hypothetical protein
MMKKFIVAVHPKEKHLTPCAPENRLPQSSTNDCRQKGDESTFIARAQALSEY